MRSFIFLTCILFASLAAAQKDTTNVNLIIEDGYIEKITNQIGLKFSLNNDVTRLDLESGGQDFEVLTNGATQAKLSLQLGSFSVAFIKFFPDISGDNSDPEKGNTDSWGLGSDFYKGRFINSIFFRRTEGFYVDNTDEINPNFPDPYILLPNHEYTEFQVSSGYRTNTKFSFKAYELQTERQLKSAGTFLPKFTYKFGRIEDKTKVNDESRFVLDNHEITLGVGYFYTHVINDFFFTAGFVPGLGIGFSTAEQRDPSGNLNESNTNTVFRYDAELAAGYNGYRFFAGAEFSATGDTFNAKELQPKVTSANVIGQVFVGYRINLPESLRNLKPKAAAKG